MVLAAFFTLAFAGAYPDMPLRGHVGKPAPAIVLRDTTGARIDLRRYRGRWLYLDFFASWCAPCNAEMPSIVRNARAAGSRLAVIAIDEREAAERARSFAYRYGATFTIALDGPDLQATDWHKYVYGVNGPFGAAEGSYGTNALPAGVLIDPKGVVRAEWGGYDGVDRLGAALRRFGIIVPTAPTGAVR
jgi:thiol-disulfide isomerase/thioredoxin